MYLYHNSYYRLKPPPGRYMGMSVVKQMIIEVMCLKIEAVNKITTITMVVPRGVKVAATTMLLVRGENEVEVVNDLARAKSKVEAVVVVELRKT